MNADLHLHTAYSDGFSGPTEIVMEAALNNLDTIAITDHDCTGGYLEAKMVADRFDINVLSGVEISVEKFHMLGYAFDIHNSNLQEFLYYARECHHNILKKKIEILSRLGLPISYHKIEAKFPTSRLGSLHLVRTISADPECIEFHKQEYSSQQIYKMYLPLPESDLNKIEPNQKDAIDVIHAAGGFAVLAHPSKKDCTMEDLERLRGYGLDGVEIQPRLLSESQHYLEYALKNNMIVTAGSDYHGRIMPRSMLSSADNIFTKGI